MTTGTRLTDEESSTVALVRRERATISEQLLLAIIDRLTAQGGDTEGGVTICPRWYQRLRRPSKITEGLCGGKDHPHMCMDQDCPMKAAHRAEAAPDEIAEIEKWSELDRQRERGCGPFKDAEKQKMADWIATLLQILRRPQPAPMGVDAQNLEAWLFDHVNPQWTDHEFAQALIASGIVGKVLPSEEELTEIVWEQFCPGMQPSVEDWKHYSAAAKAILNHIKGKPEGEGE